jgi:hypothetical protein
MDEWLAKAWDLFPELEGHLFNHHSHDTPVDLWIDLDNLLGMAYDETPSNDDLIGRIYDYADWCFKQPESDHAEILSSAAAFGLIENIPLNLKAADDLYRWMSIESFQGFESLFRYHLDTEDAYCRYRDEFMRKKQTYSGPSRI